MYTLHKFHFLNGISEINQLFDDILIIWPAPVYPESVSLNANIRKLNDFSLLQAKRVIALVRKNIQRPVLSQWTKEMTYNLALEKWTYVTRGKA